MASPKDVELVRRQLSDLLARQEERRAKRTRTTPPVYLAGGIAPQKTSSHQGASISWVRVDEQTQRGEIPVPCAVAKAFGDQRGFDSLGELHDCITTVTEDCLRKRLTSLLNVRDYAPSEIRGKLSADGYEARDIEKAIERAKSCALLDESRYGASFVRAHARKGWGRGRIERELRQRGIDPRSIEGYPDRFFEDDEIDRARQALATKRVSEPNREAKLARFLLSRGFSQDVAIRAARDRMVQDRSQALGEQM